MGLFDTLKSALGLQRSLEVQDPDAPLLIAAGGRDRLASLDAGFGIHVTTVPAERGWMVQVTEGEAQGPPPESMGELQVTMGRRDEDRLRGLALDFRDGRWMVSLHFELRARETPNPNGRLYLASRPLAGTDAIFYAEGHRGPLPDLADRLLEIDGVATVLFRENTVTVEREPESVWDDLDRKVDGAIRHHFLLCGRPLDIESMPERSDPLEQAVDEVIRERILPGIHRDGGDLRLVAVEDGVAKVSLHGACRTCPASSATLRLGVERTLREAFPGEIERVQQV